MSGNGNNNRPQFNMKRWIIYFVIGILLSMFFGGRGQNSGTVNQELFSDFINTLRVVEVEQGEFIVIVDAGKNTVSLVKAVYATDSGNMATDGTFAKIERYDVVSQTYCSIQSKIDEILKIADQRGIKQAEKPMKAAGWGSVFLSWFPMHWCARCCRCMSMLTRPTGSLRPVSMVVRRLPARQVCHHYVLT